LSVRRLKLDPLPGKREERLQQELSINRVWAHIAWKWNSCSE
jgi:hypothetical protein